MPAARAQEGPAACQFEHRAGAGKVAAVLDGRSFRLDDGREVRLAALEAPPAPASGKAGARAAAGLAAKRALESILAGRKVVLRQQAPAADRYGRILAHVYLTADDSPRSAGYEMLAQGFARVAARVGDADCAAALLAAEREARAAKSGLWGDRYYVILAADSLPELLAERGRFTIVEGKVASVRTSGGTIYVNFGRRWSQALTVTILKRNERIFTAAGMAPKTLEHRQLRVRGWIEERNGPRIEATRPEQIEIVEGD